MSDGSLCRSARVDRLWRVWYALLILAVQGFLLHASFQRYSTFRNRALREQWPMGPMNFHLAGAIAAALLLPLFLYAAFLPTGNYAEDGVQVGRDRDSLRVAAADVAGGVGDTPRSCLGRLRRHFMPYTCALHLLMSLCLLLPMPVLEAEEIRKEQLTKDQVWRTNLDFVIKPTATATHPVSTEVFNLLLALAILTVRYPSVFWFSNRVFSLLFSLVLCASGLHVFLAYEATSVLYKAVTAGSAESPVSSLAPAAVLALDSVGSVLLLLANAAFFEFGYAQVLSHLRKYRHYLQLEAPSSGSSDRSNGSSAGGTSEGAACCASNAHLLSGVLLLLVAVLCKAPVLWGWTGLYRSRQEPVLLAAAVSAGVCLLLWIAAWLALCCRPVWQFNIRLELEFPAKISPDYRLQHPPPGQPSSSSSMPNERRSPPSSAGSDLSKKSNQYVFMQQRSSAEIQPVSMIPTVSEQVDNASDSSYTCGGASGTLDRQAGLVKYQVRRNSAQLSAAAASGSLKRNALLARSRSGNRVTFKDRHETIPGSPGSSQNTSSDSGIEASRLNGQQPQGSAVTSLQISLNDDYARVNKQPRAPSRQSNYEDYPMLGCLFGTQPDMSASAGAPAEYYHQQTDPYGRPLPGVPVLPPPPAGYGTGASAANASAMGDPYGVPDILLSRSPFASLSRPSAAEQDHFDYYELQQQQQQQQQQHLRSGSYPSLPQPMQSGDQIEGLCSQV